MIGSSRIKTTAAALMLLFSVLLMPEPLYPQPAYQGFVTDLAGVINSEDKVIIEAVASEIKKKTGAEIAVLTVKTIDPYADIEEFSISTAESWGIGEKGKDNGLLIVLSTGERKTRIEVGYGLEGAIPDGRVGSIIDRYMIPYFRNNNFSSGLKAGFVAVAAAVAEEYEIEIEGSEFQAAAGEMRSRDTSSRRGPGLAEFIVLLIFFMTGGRIFWPLLFLSAASGRRRRYYGGGFGSTFGRSGGRSSFSGGFGGFGGGSFGGGGASRGF